MISRHTFGSIVKTYEEDRDHPILNQIKTFHWSIPLYIHLIGYTISKYQLCAQIFARGLKGVAVSPY